MDTDGFRYSVLLHLEFTLPSLDTHRSDVSEETEQAVFTAGGAGGGAAGHRKKGNE